MRHLYMTLIAVRQSIQLKYGLPDIELIITTSFDWFHLQRSKFRFE